jgi:hypothetical protein
MPRRYAQLTHSFRDTVQSPLLGGKTNFWPLFGLNSLGLSENLCKFVNILVALSISYCILMFCVCIAKSKWIDDLKWQILLIKSNYKLNIIVQLQEIRQEPLGSVKNEEDYV